MLFTKTVKPQKVQDGIIPSFQGPKLWGSDFLYDINVPERSLGSSDSMPGPESV